MTSGTPEAAPGSPGPRPGSRSAILAVVILTALAHLPAVLAPDASFVYDDTRFILLNDDVRTMRAPWTYLR